MSVMHRSSIVCEKFTFRKTVKRWHTAVIRPQTNKGIIENFTKFGGEVVQVN